MPGYCGFTSVISILTSAINYCNTITGTWTPLAVEDTDQYKVETCIVAQAVVDNLGPLASLFTRLTEEGSNRLLENAPKEQDMAFARLEIKVNGAKSCRTCFGEVWRGC